MAFDYKKEYPEFYLPRQTPAIVDVPEMHYLAIAGTGNPNEEDGAYQHALTLLYAAAYTLKMSSKGTRKIDGFFEYVVPPLEGFWWQGNYERVDYRDKSKFSWISLIRLPDFIREEDVAWAKAEILHKKGLDASKLNVLRYHEGLCVQCLHLGPYDDEPETIARMEEFAAKNGYAIEITEQRYHHEIYLSDARRAKPETWKTILRHPIRKLD